MQKVRSFFNKINEIAPFQTAYSWDNCGLLIGEMDAIVENVLISLDVTDKVVDYAVLNKINLIISHHPVIFQGIKKICEKKLIKLIENKIAVISAHTNLDVSSKGVNTVLAKALDLINVQPLNMLADVHQYQLSVYTPEQNVSELMDAMHQAGAGVIGNYSHCATYFDTFGQYMPLANSHPNHGNIDKLEKVKEIKIEVLCEEYNLNSVIKAMTASHPYETPVYTVVQLKQKSSNFALGTWGELKKEMSLKDFSCFVKDSLNAPFVKLWCANKSEDIFVKNIAVCGGSGNSIIHEAKKVADVFVSSDFTYHQLLDAPLPVIDGGHFFIENPVTVFLKELFVDFDCKVWTVSAQEHDIKNLKVYV